MTINELLKAFKDLPISKQLSLFSKMCDYLAIEASMKWIARLEQPPTKPRKQKVEYITFDVLDNDSEADTSEGITFIEEGESSTAPTEKGKRQTPRQRSILFRELGRLN